MPLLKQQGNEYVFIRGKHEGDTLDRVAEDDPSYLQWLHKDDKAGSDLPKEAWEALEEVMEEYSIEPK